MSPISQSPFSFGNLPGDQGVFLEAEGFPSVAVGDCGGVEIAEWRVPAGVDSVAWFRAVADAIETRRDDRGGA